MNNLQGTSIVAGERIRGGHGQAQGRAAGSGEALEPPYGLLSDHELAAATAAAGAAFASYRATTPTERADFLNRIATEIEADRDAIASRAVLESGLPQGRIDGEVGRTTGQLRLFARVVAAGDHLGVRIDPAQPDRKPLPRADIRQRMVPLGPVAVFGASNFPLAFSVAGGDTASALAAGCPVVVKAHPAHPGTSELVGAAVTRAVTASGLHPGVFSLVFGEGTAIGQALVTDPAIKAVGFTGSRAGGLALVAAAAARPTPIPVYAEMSSINPVFVLPGALTENPEALAEAYVGSLTLGSGQFCTNPGLVYLPIGEAGDRFVAEAGRRVAEATGTTMLTDGIAQAYRRTSQQVREASGVDVIAEGRAGGEEAPAPQLVSVSVATLAQGGPVAEEVFGSAGVVVRYGEISELVASLADLDGQLTATVHGTDADTDAARLLLPALEDTVGRILVNGWPTGVEVGHAMVHGGPFPATSDSRSTSVGSLAIERFQRPVSYQDLPADWLPPALADDNPWGLVRRIDGELSLPGNDRP